jgi:hypothetical protein
MQEHPNGDITAPGFSLAADQLTLTNTVLVNPKIGGDGPFAKHWFNGKAYYSDEALRLDLNDALKRLNDTRAGIHQAG